ncbi:asparagine--tRNA ligase [Oceanivirga miroungae]|uniref:Asparagine--tRNA ligase n=1 Tax=Oceanivirga miroungae TaxID=1130046 RepID=A0A6I8M866_9FUSO|nr:asparagine--tRNA ligase [Oceanivirga miroungae]VWL85732.1 asparaginyl-tRNA synthetase [Oceanivirga miroungae]
MELRILAKEISKYEDKTVKLEGWVKKNRDQKEFGFIEFNDGTAFNPIQVVYDKQLDNFTEVSKLNVYSSIIVEGKLVKSIGSGQNYEIKANKIEVLNKTPLEYPLQNKRHSFEYLRTISHLRPRTNTFNAVFRVRSILAYALHKFFQEKGFIYVHTPIITGTDAEGAGEMFQITTLDFMNKNKKLDYKDDFFAKPAFLTVTGQLHVESFNSAFRNTYTFGPTFRAENSNTTKHAAEFWMLEPEIAFANLEVNMDIIEEMIKYVIKYVYDNAKDEMDFFDKFIEKGLHDKLNNILDNGFARVTYTEAIKLLQESKNKFEIDVEWGMDLKTEHERYLAEQIFKRPVFVTDYPKDIKAFYMKLNDDNKTVRAVDLLAPGIGEIVGGSQREEDYDKLMKVINEKGLNYAEYEWYLDLRKYGSVPHSGFGLGFERILMYITGIPNIRDVIPFARTTRQLEY